MPINYEYQNTNPDIRPIVLEAYQISLILDFNGQQKNFYEILGIPFNSTTEEIRKAYKRKAVAIHPDRNENSEQSTNLFKTLGKVYEILVDPEAREVYNQRCSLEFTHLFVNKYNITQLILGAKLNGSELISFITKDKKLIISVLLALKNHSVLSVNDIGALFETETSPEVLSFLLTDPHFSSLLIEYLKTVDAKKSSLMTPQKLDIIFKNDITLNLRPDFKNLIEKFAEQNENVAVSLVSYFGTPEFNKLFGDDYDNNLDVIFNLRYHVKVAELLMRNFIFSQLSSAKIVTILSDYPGRKDFQSIIQSNPNISYAVEAFKFLGDVSNNKYVYDFAQIASDIYAAGLNVRLFDFAKKFGVTIEGLHFTAWILFHHLNGSNFLRPKFRPYFIYAMKIFSYYRYQIPTTSLHVFPLMTVLDANIYNLSKFLTQEECLYIKSSAQAPVAVAELSKNSENHNSNFTSQTGTENNSNNNNNNNNNNNTSNFRNNSSNYFPTGTTKSERTTITVAELVKLPKERIYEYALRTYEVAKVSVTIPEISMRLSGCDLLNLYIFHGEELLRLIFNNEHLLNTFYAYLVFAKLNCLDKFELKMEMDFSPHTIHYNYEVKGPQLYLDIINAINFVASKQRIQTSFFESKMRRLENYRKAVQYGSVEATEIFERMVLSEIYREENSNTTTEWYADCLLLMNIYKGQNLTKYFFWLVTIFQQRPETSSLELEQLLRDQKLTLDIFKHFTGSDDPKILRLKITEDLVRIMFKTWLAEKRYQFIEKLFVSIDTQLKAKFLREMFGFTVQSLPNNNNENEKSFLIKLVINLCKEVHYKGTTTPLSYLFQQQKYQVLYNALILLQSDCPQNKKLYFKDLLKKYTLNTSDKKRQLLDDLITYYNNLRANEPANVENQIWCDQILNFLDKHFFVLTINELSTKLQHNKANIQVQAMADLRQRFSEVELKVLPQIINTLYSLEQQEIAHNNNNNQTTGFTYSFGRMSFY